MVSGAEASQLRVLSEEALILVAVAGACVLLVLGVLELMWPTRPRHARRVRLEPAVDRSVLAASPRPTQSILPRRLIDSPSASRPAGVFPPPADYVPPPPPSEEARPPVRPIGVVTPAAPAAPEPVVPYIPPPDVEVEPPAIEPPPIGPPLIESPPSESLPSEAAVEAEPSRDEPEPPPLDAAEPAPEPRAPEREPIVQLAPPSFEPVAAPLEPAEPPQPDEPEPSPMAPERRPIVQLVAPPFEPLAPPRELAPSPPGEPALPPRRRRSKISPHARPHRVLRPAPPEDPSAEGPTPFPASPPLHSAPVTSTLAADATPTRDSPLVERCFALYQGKRFDEVLSLAEPALAGSGREAPVAPSRETAALWSVVGLAKQALGDDDGAHAALASSIDAALDPERSTYRRHLASHALDAAHARLSRAGSHDPVERLAVIRAAIAWAERGLAVVPADQALGDAREASHEALWQAYERAATTLLQRQEFTGAREILHEALDDPELPPVRAAGFRGLLSGTFGGEIGQLTAQAIVSMQDGHEAEALGVLQRAEELLAAIPADTIPSTRRDEIDQRLWWGYAELGSRRLDAGDYEEALAPLVRALRFTSIGAERQAETRAAVVRALEGIASVRALSIRRLAEAGSREEAIASAGGLNELVKRGLKLGITEDELTAAFARLRRLCEELGIDSPG